MKNLVFDIYNEIFSMSLFGLFGRKNLIIFDMTLL